MNALIHPVPPAAATLPAYAGRHDGAIILVCGCGPSLNELVAKPGCISIGVNDVGRRFDPDYLVVVNPPSQFSSDRLRAITESRARAVFSQYADFPLTHAPLVSFRLGAFNGTDFSNPEVLHYTQNSPYVALCLAIHMGARRIGLIGVDFTDDHFFGATGRHPLSGRLVQIEREYAALQAACVRSGVEVFTVGAASRLTAFPRRPLEDFLRGAAEPQRSAALRIVSYATTPVAGVPAILARCIAARTPHRARCVWATNNYGNGVVFEGDIEWSQHATEAEAAIAEADVIIAHNGKIDEHHHGIVAGKPIVTMAHNYAWNVDARFVQQGMPGIVVGQYQATLPEFAGWTAVPNPVPFWEPAFSPDAKGDVITIAYTPSGRHDSYPEGHRLYWHGKGYATTMRTLEALARRYPLRLLTVRDRQMSHSDALAAKRCAHIVIDECITGSYHRNSLEGLACGAVVVNGVGLLPAVARMLLHCAGDPPDMPFVHASSDTLEQVLRGLIETGPAALAETGRRNRAWLEANWDFAGQWRRFWQPAIEQASGSAARGEGIGIGALEPSGPGSSNASAALTYGERPPTDVFHPQRIHGKMQQSLASQPRSSITAEASAPGGGLSVVIPFGGRDRLGLLAATLAGLRQSTAVAQVIVSEAGSESAALDLAQRWDADHVFIAAPGPFDKVRALNTGSLLARQPELLWCDGDLLFGEHFLGRALQEFKASGFDFLFPFSRIHYLDDAQSREVCAGARSLGDCRPARVLRPMGGGAVGGMGMVRAEFLRRHGGLIEGFRGWGGEDNAWVKKVSLLGRIGVTRHTDQVIWHLHHPDSGTPGPQRNPHYLRNVELLARIERIRTAGEFLQQFPQPDHAIPPWPAQSRIAFVAVLGTSDAWAPALANAWAQDLSRAYRCTVEVLQTDAAVLAATLHGLCADAVVAFANDAAALAALATVEHARPTVLALGDTNPDDSWPFASAGGPWLLARTPEQVAGWCRRGLMVWHRAWDDPASSAKGAMPVVVQPLSHILNALPKAATSPRPRPAGVPKGADAPPPEGICIGVHVHSRPERLDQTLAFLRANSPPNVEIMLLADGPDPAMRARLAGLPEYRQSVTADPRGAAACFNRLLRESVAEVMVFLESGSLVGPGWLDLIVATLRADPRNGLAGPTTNIAWSLQGAFRDRQASTANVAELAAQARAQFGAQWQTLEPLHCLSDFCYAIRRDVAEAIGGADEGYGFGACWEMDYTIRAVRSGFQAVWSQGAYVFRQPFTPLPSADEPGQLETSKRRYQDKFCGLRLSGNRTFYAKHCSGDACRHFAPTERIRLFEPLGGGVPKTTAPAPSDARNLSRAQPATAAGDPPLVSCIMPTRNRHDWMMQAIRYFQRQDYCARELIIIDDSDIDHTGKLPPDARINYRHTERRLSIGAMRNLACGLARGSIIVHWDDDDWYAPGRLAAQVAPLLAGQAEITGLADTCFFELDRWRFWGCTPALHRRLFALDVHGGTLAFRRSVFQEMARYPDLSHAEDAAFLKAAVARGARLEAIPAGQLFLYVRHRTNAWRFACGQYVDSGGWQLRGEPPGLADDRDFYAGRSAAHEIVAPIEPAGRPFPAASAVSDR